MIENTLSPGMYKIKLTNMEDHTGLTNHEEIFRMYLRAVEMKNHELDLIYGKDEVTKYGPTQEGYEKFCEEMIINRINIKQ